MLLFWFFGTQGFIQYKFCIEGIGEFTMPYNCNFPITLDINNTVLREKGLLRITRTAKTRMAITLTSPFYDIS